ALTKTMMQFREPSWGCIGDGLRLALVLDQELDGARRGVALVLVAMDRAAWDVDEFAGLEHLGGLPFDGEGDLALDHHFPLIAIVAVEPIAGPVRKMELHLHLHLARWVFIERRGEEAPRERGAGRRCRGLRRRRRYNRSHHHDDGDCKHCSTHAILLA